MSTTARRDLHMVFSGLRGQAQPSFSLRTPRRSDVLRLASQATAAEAMSVLKPRSLVVRAVRRETPDAVTLVLADPQGGPIAFAAGQFFTLLIAPPSSDGPPLRRAYSACTSPLADDGTPTNSVAITCKRVAGGLVSSYLNDRSAEGDVVQVLGPSGNFTPEPRADRRRHLVLLGGGSGITPLMSILRTVLQCEPQSRISLLYGNRGEADIIFYRDLAQLAAQHPDRLCIRHVLSDPPTGWNGGHGLLDEPTLQSELSQLALLPALTPAAPTFAADLPLSYYLCGPTPMMDAARQVLLQAGVSAHEIWEERFASLHEKFDGKTAATTPVNMHLDVRRLGSATTGKSQKKTVHEVIVKPGETLLEAGLTAGVELPFSCAMGGCGACKSKLHSGHVTMPEPNCLTTAERAQGYILPCIAKPRGDVTVSVEI